MKTLFAHVFFTLAPVFFIFDFFSGKSLLLLNSFVHLYKTLNIMDREKFLEEIGFWKVTKNMYQHNFYSFLILQEGDDVKEIVNKIYKQAVRHKQDEIRKALGI